MTKICHITTVHGRYDTRIFYKQLHSLAKKFECSLIVADGLGNEKIEGINVIDIGKPANIFSRVFVYNIKAYKKALSVNASLYQIHDPELIFIAAMLSLFNRKVAIFDSHEDVPSDIKQKTWMPKPLRFTISYVYRKIEFLCVKTLSATLAPTIDIQQRLLKIKSPSILIKNFPLLKEFERSTNDTLTRKKLTCCYVGSISCNRGVLDMLDLVHKNNCNFLLAGVFTDVKTEQLARQHPGWKNTEYLGYVDNKKVSRIYIGSDIGLLLLSETETFLSSSPVKLFEYMSEGLPVISWGKHDFNQLISDSGAGLICDYGNQNDIAIKMSFLLRNQQELKKMSIMGKKYAEINFCWRSQEKLLYQLYEQLLKTKDMS